MTRAEFNKEVRAARIILGLLDGYPAAEVLRYAEKHGIGGEELEAVKRIWSAHLEGLECALDRDLPTAEDVRGILKEEGK
jgi:hypothetical protein